jgi:SET domain-containing protein
VSEIQLIEVRESAIHGRGVFALCDIHAGTLVTEYVGEVITKAESLLRCEENNQYIFHLDDEHDLDGNVDWNPARFINHGCSPNCESEMRDGHIMISALRHIAQGEEITFNYGYDLEDYEDHPCHCGSPRCVGYIVAEEFFATVRAKAANRVVSSDLPW